MRITAEPRSDQWNADDFIVGPRTFTIKQVHPGRAEQKYDFELVEGEGRAWRPPVTMLRVLTAAWGDQAQDYRGRRVTLFLDPTVKYGGKEVGGIRISHLSHIDQRMTLWITESRGRRTQYTVDPLPTPEPAGVDPDAIEQATTLEQLKDLWEATPPPTDAQRERIQVRKAEMEQAAEHAAVQE